MSKIDSAPPSISVVFDGEDVEKTLADNPAVTKAVWGACLGAGYHTTIKVHVAPRINDMTPLEWYMSIASPSGRKTLTILQRVSAGAVQFIPN